MKKYFFSFILLFVFNSIYAQFVQDSLAIIQLLEKEGNTWRFGDIKGDADCWAERANTGHMQIWRMLADGSKPEQLTFDENSNWFAHPSPDGNWIAYIAYTSDEKQAHSFGKQVKLRLMNLETKDIKDITPVFFGGQGTINVPSWSADSKKVAFVSYSVK